jgi:ABC-type lipoprotein export system ATPase subunit
VDQRRQTILMVTHNPRHAALADRLVRLRDGRVVEEQALPRERTVGEVLRDLEALS